MVFAYDHSFSTKAFKVDLPLKTGSHLCLPIRQMVSGCGIRGRDIDNI